MVNRGYVLGILASALLFVEVSKDVIFSRDRGHWHPAWDLCYYVTMLCLPFVLARVAPRAASFATQWLPNSRWQWAWFVGMVFLLFVSRALVVAPAPLSTASVRTDHGAAHHANPCPPPGNRNDHRWPSCRRNLLSGLCPGSVKKSSRAGIALLVQSLLFGIFHLVVALNYAVNGFFLGLILGAWRIKFRSLLPLVIAHVLFNATLIPFLKVQYDQAVAKSYARCPTISKETTYITEPLRKDGFPDYVAVLNRKCSEGVTPENNSAVLFWKVVGPSSIYSDDREKYFQVLGIPSLPEKGDYFVDLEKYLAQQKGDGNNDNAKTEEKARDEAYNLIDPALKRPWSKEEFPALAAWLATNEKPLSLLAEASKRPRRYDPLVSGEKIPLIAVMQPSLDAFHVAGDIASALVARAMLRLESGEFDESWEDLLTCHRHVRLVGQGPTGIDAVVRMEHGREGVRRGAGVFGPRVPYGGPDCEDARGPRPAAPNAQRGRRA